MKKHYIFILIILAFILGYFVCKISIQRTSEKISSVTEEMQKNTLQSGVYRELYFESIRKDGNPSYNTREDSYYIKFSKQTERVILECDPPKTASDAFWCEEGLNGWKDKEKPDIDLSKEYKFIPRYGSVALINSSPHTIELLSIDWFYDLIHKNQISKTEYYSGVIEEPKNVPFEVTMVNGEVTNITQIYQE